MLISIRDHDPKPIYLQIAQQVKDQIRDGTLRPGDELPSVRELAGSLGVNLHTVHAAYRKLNEQGVVALRLGRRARVAAPSEKPADPEAAEALLSGRIRETITEAYHLGVSPRDLRALFHEILKSQTQRGTWR